VRGGGEGACRGEGEEWRDLGMTDRGGVLMQPGSVGKHTHTYMSTQARYLELHQSRLL
jgi:hypothetical protein